MEKFYDILKYAYVAREISRGNFDDMRQVQSELLFDIVDSEHLVYYYFVRKLHNYLMDEYMIYKKTTDADMTKILLNSYGKHLGGLADLTGIIYNTFGLPIYNTNQLLDFGEPPDDYIEVIKGVAGDIRVKEKELRMYYEIDNIYMLLANLILIWKKRGYQSVIFRAARLQILRKCVVLLRGISNEVFHIGTPELMVYYTNASQLYTDICQCKVNEYYDFMYILMGVPDQLIPVSVGNEYVK